MCETFDGGESDPIATKFQPRVFYLYISLFYVVREQNTLHNHIIFNKNAQVKKENTKKCKKVLRLPLLLRNITLWKV